VCVPGSFSYEVLATAEEKKPVDRMVALAHSQRPEAGPFLLCDGFGQLSEFAHLSTYGFRQMKRLVPGRYAFWLRATKQIWPSMLASRNVQVQMAQSPIEVGLLSQMGHPLAGFLVSSEAEALVHPSELKTRFGENVSLILDAGPEPWSQPTVLSLVEDDIALVHRGDGEWLETS
jgi:tRNA A37 threonylcarbamoyladenosine synthetase subunit TsaC/SUA5/YrdC